VLGAQIITHLRISVSLLLKLGDQFFERRVFKCFLVQLCLELLFLPRQVLDLNV